MRVSSLHQLLESEPVADRSHRARIFRPGIESDRQGLEELLRSIPHVWASDTIQRQLWELIKTRHPDRKLTVAEHESLIADELAGRPPLEYGAWAFYPWSRRLVHLLDEPAFGELRTNRNTYKITPQERDALATKRIGVVGLSVGQSVALVLALERACGELRLADFDTLDLSNLNRLRAGVHAIGLPKVVVTAREIAEIDPYLNVVCYFDGVTSANMETFLAEPEPLDLLIEECDSLDLKVEIRHAARQRRIPVVMDTSDRGLLDIERFDLEPQRPLFHGLVGDLMPGQLRGLSTEEKIPYVLKIIGEETISLRMRASLLEIDQTISTWPQLASAVALGGGVAGDAARRILLGEPIASGRFFVDPVLTPSRVDESSPDAWQALQANTVPEAILVPRDTRDFADEGVAVAESQLERFVTAACLAPSGGNAQPWRWVWRDRSLWLFLDRRYSRALLDFRSLASIAALGAASENLVLAAHAEGLGVHVTPFPDPVEPSCVACFRFCVRGGPRDEPKTSDHLVSVIRERVTNRHRGTRARLPEGIFGALDASIASVPGADLKWLRSDDELEEAGDLLGAGDRVIFLDQRLHHELMTEIEFEAKPRPRGIAVATLELSPSDRAGLEVSRSWAALSLVKEWGGGANLEKMSRKAIGGASAAGMLRMPARKGADYYAGGRAMQRLWLTATELGLGLQPMTALSYLFARLNEGGAGQLTAETSQRLRELWPRWAQLFALSGSEGEVLTFRLTTAPAPSARSGRCPVREVLLVE